MRSRCQRAPKRPDDRPQFSLAELLVVVTGFCVVLGLISLLAPYRPVVLSIAALVAFLVCVVVGLFVLPTLGSLFFASVLLGEDNRIAKRPAEEQRDQSDS